MHAEAGMHWRARGSAAVAAAGEQVSGRTADPHKSGHSPRGVTDNFPLEVVMFGC